jgi:hypothetical protein
MDPRLRGDDKLFSYTFAAALLHLSFPRRRESIVTISQAFTENFYQWIPAYAGMTSYFLVQSAEINLTY